MEKLLASPLFAHRTPNPETLRYGTAGFRLGANFVAPIACRLGPVFVERAAQLYAGAATTTPPLCFGVMVTASHNSAADNGLKIVEPPHAHMLAPESEGRATELARTKDAAEFSALFAKIMSETEARGPRPNWSVVVGWDTRASCGEIVDALALGIEAAGGKVFRAGQMTTPMLHWCVERANMCDSELAVAVPPLSEYITQRAEWFAAAVATHCASGTSPIKRHVIVDCANGIGTGVMKQLAALLKDNGELAKHVDYTFELINTNTDDGTTLNDRCGADFVQKQQLLPHGFTFDDLSQRTSAVAQQSGGGSDNTCILYSLDGDADRLVAGAVSEDGKSSVIFEGDRFTALFATVLASADDKTLSYGAVQTAYANGASTAYLKSCAGGALKTEFALTGVKHVHAAATKYDIGIYFESNGHGTVLTSRKAADPKTSTISPKARVVAQLCSQSCGDAIANLLATEYALLLLKWTPWRWLGLYTDLPCVQKKVPVADPAVFKCAPGNEQQLVQPAGVQDEVAKVVAEQNDARVRAFVRPSGTEPVVRTYVEAPNIETAQKMTEALEDLIKKVAK